ncbi:HD-GYP domain-containing protein [Halanaerobaculum tunisiense]
MNRRLKLFLGVEYSIFSLFFCYLYQTSIDPVSTKEVIFFVLLLFLITNISAFINTSTKLTTHISLPVLIPAIISLGPFWASIVAFLSTTIINKIKNDFIWYKFIFNRTMFFIATGCAALVFEISKGYFSTSYFWLSLLLTSIVYFLINNGLVFLVVKIESENSNFSALLYFFELSKNVFISYLYGTFLYFIYIKFGKGYVVLGMLFIYLMKDFLYSNIQQLNYSTQIVRSFLKVIDSKDHYTEGHCKRVAEYTRILCKNMKLSPGKCNQIVQMAKIHDIGKINVSDEILKCSGRLTDEQYEKIKNHSIYGYQLLKDIDLLNNGLEIIKYHHERYDGTGYPAGIAGEEIPLGARILKVCDAFDVMTRGRVYKPSMNKEEVLQELKDCAEIQFDPQIAREMIDLINQGEFADSFKENIIDYDSKSEVAVTKS